jgi:hypothetical protein
VFALLYNDALDAHGEKLAGGHLQVHGVAEHTGLGVVE